MRDAAHAIREELRGVLIFIGVIWAAFILNWVVYPIDFNAFGVVPRTLFGVIGIPIMPFLHAGVGHLISNSVALFVLLALLAGSRARSWEVVAKIILVGGILLWVFGRPATHVGASGLIFGLIAFLILSGILEKRPIPLTVSFGVGILYGGTLIVGVLPSAGSHVSWDGHLCGAIAGGLSAFFLARESRQQEQPMVE